MAPSCISTTTDETSSKSRGRELNKAMPTSARSLYTADTLLSADSIEFDPRTPGLFALGTYQVDQREEAQASSGGGKDDDDEKEKEGDGDGTKEEDRAYTRRGRLTLHQILDGKDDDSVQV
ncbi:hypothetical protein CF335_g2377 [Tilletia laevis]|nr:hypothetical protein CF335_g2377 [Tilletia laevis]